MPFQVLEVIPAGDLEVVVDPEEELTLAAHVTLIVIVDVMVVADLAVAVEVVLVEVISSMGVKRCVLNYDMCFFVLVFFGVCIDR